MNSKFRILLGIGLSWVAAPACGKIIGIETKFRVQESDSGLLSNSCGAVSTNGIGLRVANMVPSDRKVDVCIKPTGGNYPHMPMLQAGGSECPDGIGYGQYTVRLNVAAGNYDVKLVAQGSDCNAEGPSASNVQVSPLADGALTSSTTIVAFGQDWSTGNAQIAALKDAHSTGADIYLRFFHGFNGGGTLDAGLVKSNPPPPVITSNIFESVPFGAIAAASLAGALAVDSDGYMIYPVQSSNVGGLNLGASYVNSSTREAFVDSFVNLTKEHHYTLFLIGIAGSTDYVPKLWSCDETASLGAFADCGDPRPVNVGIFHPNLTDIFTDYVDVREPHALSAIANPDLSTDSTANVLCVPELYSPETRGRLKNLLGTTTTVFSDDYAVSPNSDLTDEDGATPTYKPVVCDGPLQEGLQAFESCLLDPELQKACIAEGAADAGDTKHYFAFKGSQAIGCAALACQTEVAQFVLAESYDAYACFMCAIAHLSSGEAIEDMYSACTTPNEGRPHLVFGGSTGLAVIVKSPLTLAPNENPEVIALPASTWNRAALRVPLKLPNNAVIDFWCASVRPPNSESFLPNGGPYHGNVIASPRNIESANAAEEGLQISRLVAAVDARTFDSGRRAIVAALTYASPQIGDEVSALHPENFAPFVNSTWYELVASSYTPACTFCGDNPLNPTQVRQWMEHIFGIGIEPNMVTETQRTFMSNAVNLVLYSDPTGEEISAPVSQYYGIQSTVRISQ